VSNSTAAATGGSAVHALDLDLAEQRHVFSGRQVHGQALVPDRASSSAGGSAGSAGACSVLVVETSMRTQRRVVRISKPERYSEKGSDLAAVLVDEADRDGGSPGAIVVDGADLGQVSWWKRWDHRCRVPLVDVLDAIAGGVAGLRQLRREDVLRLVRVEEGRGSVQPSTGGLGGTEP